MGGVMPQGILKGDIKDPVKVYLEQFGFTLKGKVRDKRRDLLDKKGKKIGEISPGTGIGWCYYLYMEPDVPFPEVLVDSWILEK